ncbi:pro-neuregulin-4, membrane-bound isoform isoform X1 [Oxyura jamaicensis]|uniref:pro-neuregulin-4, membrane-bound isoform isoform X1 n=1 Tax=Oxyura jamaicensis TaxID=8884 RepID=UPI0015A694DC|nr:pro-neuregulin-4, membrane-bound isoform isoform X1 [Oxyura jamaicensis]
MVSSSLLGRAFTLCLVYVPNIKQCTFLDGFIFVLPSSKILTTDLSLTLSFPVDISDTRSQEVYSLGPFLKQYIIQPGVLAGQALPSLRIPLFYSHNHLLITPIYILLSGSLQDSLTLAKRGQMTWSFSLSALMTQRDQMGSQRHRKWELNNFIFNSFLSLEVATRKKHTYFHNGTLPSSSLYGIYNVVLKRKFIEKIPGFQRGENAECRFLISKIKKLEVYKNVGAKKNLNKLQFLGCLLHALVSEKILCILYQRRRKHSKTEKKRHNATVYKVRSQGENRNIKTIRKQHRKIHYFLRTHFREVGAQVKAQHLQGKSESIKASRGPDPEKLLTTLYKSLKDKFLPKLTELRCYFLDFKPLADTHEEADNVVLKARKDESGFSSHMDIPALNAEFRCAAILTATLESVLLKILGIASVEISHRQLLNNFHVLLIMRHSDLVNFSTLFSLKEEKAYGHLKWKFRKEILTEDVKNKWIQVVRYNLLQPSQLSRQAWNSYSVLPIMFPLSRKQITQKVRMNKPKPCLNANKLIYETTLSLNEILLAIPVPSNPLQLRTFQLLKLLISTHKLGEFVFQVKSRLGYKFIFSWPNATESAG